MNVNEMILVIENRKGTETNFLLTFDDYKKLLLEGMVETMPEVADVIMDLCKSLNDGEHWSDVYVMANKSFCSRFCKEEGQLRSFLGGYFNELDSDWGFDETRSSWDCLETLGGIGIGTNGRGVGIQFHYQVVEQSISQGNILHNFNGRDYRVMEKLTQQNLLLLNEKSSEFVVAIGVTCYVRYPKGALPNRNNQLYGIEWGHGVYLSQTPSTIDFMQIRKEYGTPKESHSLEGFREELLEQFLAYHKICHNSRLSEQVRDAAQESIYQEFQTGKIEVFQENWHKGVYDRAFLKEKNDPVVVEMSR
jgi:hypothetical protein